MDPAESRPRAQDERGKPPERKGPQRQRGDNRDASARQPQEPRRRRNLEQRYAGWGDGIDRAFCAHAAHALPGAFPVESHPGAATIPRVVVARREGAVLLCNYSHCGPHLWPDGETAEPPDAPAG